MSGGEWIHVYVWLGPFAAHLKLSQHYPSAVPQYKTKSLFFKKKEKKKSLFFFFLKKENKSKLGKQFLNDLDFVAELSLSQFKCTDVDGPEGVSPSEGLSA